LEKHSQSGQSVAKCSEMLGWWMVGNGYYACFTLGMALAMAKILSNVACFFAEILQKCIASEGLRGV